MAKRRPKLDWIAKVLAPADNRLGCSAEMILTRRTLAITGRPEPIVDLSANRVVALRRLPQIEKAQR
jgi:hypothetical protein